MDCGFTFMIEEPEQSPFEEIHLQKNAYGQWIPSKVIPEFGYYSVRSKPPAPDSP
jgi:hypothetical protein